MWLLLSRKTQLYIIVGASLLVTGALESFIAWMTGAVASPLKLVSFVVFIIGTISVGVLNYFWRPLWRRFPLLGRAIFPDLNGTWKGTLKTTWVDSAGVTPAPIEATVLVRQSLFGIHVQLLSYESDSRSQRVFPEADGEAGRFGLWYSYYNQPRATVSKTSAPHDGVARLELSRRAGEACLSGRYFTSRQTTGDINVVRESTEIIEP